MLQRCVRRSRNGRRYPQADGHGYRRRPENREGGNSLTQLVAKKNEDPDTRHRGIAADRVSSEIHRLSAGQSENARQIKQVRQYVDKKGVKLPRPRIKSCDQVATIQQIQRVQSDTRNELNAMYMLKVQKTKNGISYVAGLARGLRMLMVRPRQIFCCRPIALR